nr:MAG TPA: hypothetical protein [Caudoviricetes sp.]
MVISTSKPSKVDRVSGRDYGIRSNLFSVKIILNNRYAAYILIQELTPG